MVIIKIDCEFQLAKLKKKIAKTPQCPGVYFFYDKNKKNIYIGKATNLKNRVSSYFSGYKNNDRPIETMIHQVADIKIKKTETVLEALILESNLIKKYQPKYNVKEKDDKSFSYFVITKEEFPKVLISRKSDLIRRQEDKSSLFGPYVSKKQMEIALKIMRKIFPFHSSFQKSEKGCLDFQLGRCPGPYAGMISKKEYKKNIVGIKMILSGKKNTLLKKLKKDMLVCAAENNFERAAEIRNKIFALKHIQDIALMTQEKNQREFYDNKNNLRIEAYDISNISGESAVGSMIVFEGGEPNKKEYRKFRIKTVAGINDVAMMQEVLLRRWKNNWKQPDLIMLDGGAGHLRMAEKLLKELGVITPVVAIAKGINRKNTDIRMADFGLKEGMGSFLRDKDLIKRIMDEAHRFAIEYHRKIRKKSFLQE